MNELAAYNWNTLFNAIDCNSDTLDNIYNDFSKILRWHIDVRFPARIVIWPPMIFQIAVSFYLQRRVFIFV